MALVDFGDQITKIYQGPTLYGLVVDLDTCHLQGVGGLPAGQAAKHQVHGRRDLLRHGLVGGILRGRAQLTALDYKAVLAGCIPQDMVYLNPPY